MKLKDLLVFVQRNMLLKASNEKRIKYLRKQGVRIGERCIIQTLNFSTEQFLVEIGNHVAIAAGVQFITHDGAAAWSFREELNGGVFGKITIGNDVFIGMNSILLPGTNIGNNSIVGAGSVVRGKFPDNSVVIGNPAKVVYGMNLQKMVYKLNPGLCKTLNLSLPDFIKLLKERFSID